MCFQFVFMIIYAPSGLYFYYYYYYCFVFCSFVFRGIGYQSSPAADGAISLGHGLGGNAVPFKPGFSAGQKFFPKMVAG